MIKTNAKIATILSEAATTEAVKKALIMRNFHQIVSFDKVESAYEVLSRQQVDVVICEVDLPDNPGVTLMQRLINVGNYGMEPFFYLGQKVDPSTLAIFVEYDMNYFLSAPWSVTRILEKIDYMVATEAALSPEQTLYRDARSAMISGVLDMAESFAQQLHSSGQLLEKAEILLGDIALKRNHLEVAEGFFANILRNHPRNLCAIHKLAKVYMEKGQLERAKSYLDQLVDAHPHHILGLQQAGLTNFKLGHSDLAEQQLTHLTSMDRTNKVAGATLTKIAVAKGQWDGIAERLRHSHSEKELVSVLNNAGVKLSRDADFQSALSIYQQCLAIVTKDQYISKIHYNIAVAQRGLNQIKPAIQSLEKALQVDPKLVQAQSMLLELKQKVA